MKLEFHHINLCTSDVPEMDQFYRKILDLRPEPSLEKYRIKREDGYSGGVAFQTDGNVQFHHSQRDLEVALRARKHINPLERGHLAFRTDDIAAFKKRLEDNGIPYADYGDAFMQKWQQIFFYDPSGNIIEVHQVDETADNPN
ncbi:MAG: VOC family protein [Hyphomicrobiaceae bacterium]